MPNTRSIRLRNTVGGVNMDGLNVLNGATKDVVIVGPGKSELDDYVKRWAKPRATARSRSIPSPRRAITTAPTISAWRASACRCSTRAAGEDLVVRRVRSAGHAAAEDYTVNRYHKPQDEYDASVGLGRDRCRT